MRALVAGPSGVSLAEAPDPQAGRSQALVEVRAVSLNRGEVRRLPARAAGTIPGWDVAGVVRRHGVKGERTYSSEDFARLTLGDYYDGLVAAQRPPTG